MGIWKDEVDVNKPKNWRKPFEKETRGNPAMKKGAPSLNPAGRTKGGKNRVKEGLEKLKLDPTEELVKIAQAAMEAGKVNTAKEIWTTLLEYTEAKRKPIEVPAEASPEASVQSAEATLALLKELENGQETSSDSTGLDLGPPVLPVKTSAEADLSGDQGKQGTNLCGELLPSAGKDDNDGADSDGSSHPSAGDSSALRSPPAEPS